MKGSGDDAKQAYVETLSAAERRNYKGRITLQSYQPTALADVTPLIELNAPTPLLSILAEDEYLPWQREAYDAAKDPKSLVTIEENQFAPYTSAKREAIEAAKEWFVNYLISK